MVACMCIVEVIIWNLFYPLKHQFKKKSWDCYNVTDGKIQVESDSYCFWSQAAGFPLVGYLLLLKYSTNFDIFNESRSE